METLSSRQIVELAQISYRQLDYWIKMDLVPKADNPGSGFGRRWTREQAEFFRFLGIWARFGNPCALKRLGNKIEAALATGTVDDLLVVIQDDLGSLDVLTVSAGAVEIETAAFVVPFRRLKLTEYQLAASA